MKAIFVPSLGEASKIFPDVQFTEWQFGIQQGVFNGLDVFVTGVSKTPTTFNSAMIIRELGIKEALLAGVCGAYRGCGLSVGDLVSIEREYFADEGLYAGESFQSIFDMGFGFLEKGYININVIKGLPVASSNTVSFLDGNGAVSDILHESTKTQVENMEGAAFAYVCNMLGVKCFQVRGVSNFCGIRSKQEWNFKQAITNLKNFFVSFQF